MFRQSPLKWFLWFALTAGGIAYAQYADFFGKEILIEVAVFAMLAISVDFLAGFVGMISLGHAALYGSGAYIYAVLTAMNGWSPAAAMAAATLACGLAGLLVGLATARVRGIFFIMATLAFGQMAYVYIFENRDLGGDDGMYGVPRLDLSAWGIDMVDSANFGIFAVIMTAIVYLLMAGLMSSGFGKALIGIHRNENRMRALGLPVTRYKAAAFGISGLVAGLAGTLGAQHTGGVSPEYLNWTLSGEILIFVIFGGLETLIGPVIGTAAAIFLKHSIAAYTDHWHIFIGALLIITVLLGGKGLYGITDWIARRLGRRKSVEAQGDA